MQRWLRAWVVTLKAALNPPDPLCESASGCDLSTVRLRGNNARQTSCRSHPDADETAAYNRPPASIPESVVIERWRTEHGRGTRRRRRNRQADAALKAGLNASAALEKRRLIGASFAGCSSERSSRKGPLSPDSRPAICTHPPRHNPHALPSAPNGNQRNG